MDRELEVKVTEGRKAVKIVRGKYSVAMHTMINGHQWVGFPVDEKLLSMIEECIVDYISQTKSCSEVEK